MYMGTDNNMYNILCAIQNKIYIIFYILWSTFCILCEPNQLAENIFIRESWLEEAWF